jgi:exopolysaccharide biosynthesis protein
LIGAVIGGAAAPASADLVTTRRIARGVTLKKITKRKPRLSINAVSVKMAAPSRIRPALGSGSLPGLERTSSMARRRRALVAINGDYARSSGRPVMTFAQGSRLVQTPLSWGRNFAMTANESHAFIGHPHPKVVLGQAVGDPLRIVRVNQGAPRWDEVAMFTKAGGRLERPPRRSCSARLMPTSLPQPDAKKTGLTTRFEVGAVRCAFRRMYPAGGIVLSARREGPRAAAIKALPHAGVVTLTWSLGWPNVRETVGGNPTLVEDGRIVVGRSSSPFYARHPRTGVGTTGDGRVLLVTVDGRRRKHSVGLTLPGFAKLMRSLGATWALNLDGGGSTTMVVRGRVVNRPSDGPERPVSSALLVLPAGAGGSQRATVVPAREVWRDVATDPASTGGLADALAGRSMRLPASLERAARTFRAHSD